MEQVAELFPQRPNTGTRVWATARGRKEYENITQTDLVAMFEERANKGFQDYRGQALRDEGNGVWAFGTRTWTVRIAGYFDTDYDRKNFVVCGVWTGKPGRGGKRPPYGDTVAERTATLRRSGVEYAKAAEDAPGAD